MARAVGNQSMALMLPYTPSAVAESLLHVIEKAVSARGNATLAIPGGRSPGPVLTALASMLDDFVRARLHLLWLDERAVPRNHADRNDAPTLAAWSAGGPLPAHVHPMPAELADLDAAARQYSDTLKSATSGSPLDACLIGIGEDGHLASLFPNHPGLKELTDVFPVLDSPKPPPRRLTLSLAVLSRAVSLQILALGSAKGLIAKRAAGGPSPGIPVSLLPAARCLWFLDDQANAAFRT
jgi:6-phosphogluconolactonase